MKYNLIIIACSILLSSFILKSYYEIKGNVYNIPDGTIVYLKQVDKTNENPFSIKYITLDSATVKNNSFQFKRNEEIIDISYITFKGIPDEILFISGEGELNLIYDTKVPSKTTITGTRYNDELSAFNTQYSKLEEVADSFRMKNRDAFQEAIETNNSFKMSVLEKDFAGLLEERDNFFKNYVEGNPKSIVTLLIMKKNLIQTNRPKEEILSFYSQQLNDELQQTAIAKDLKSHADAMPDANVKIGEVAPNFTSKTPEGKDFSLKEGLGKITIIDFWASWCGPCRQENPNVVALYNDYHDKGLNILGVSVDKDHNAWKQAIEDDQLPWYQIVVQDNSIEKTYEIKSVPTLFILDEKGVVIAKDLRGDDLRKFISEKLDK